MTNNQLHKPPSFYIKKRLFANKPAMFGLALIILAHLIAGLGYLIMPDSTPNATDGAVQIQKKTPVFSIIMLKKHKNNPIREVGVFKRLYLGKESKYTIIPLKDMPEIRGDSVYFRQYSRESLELSDILIDYVKPLYVGESHKLPNQTNFIITEDSVTYLDDFEELHTISKTKLEQEFWEKNIENRSYYLGTDKSGRDVLSRLLFGTRISLAIGFVAVMISLALGTFFGSMAGFFGGKIDDLIMWLMTIVWSIPGIMLVIVISLALQSKGVWVAFVAVGLTMWVEIARVVRGQIISIKQEQYVEAARAFGFSNRRIIFKHIFPNILGPIIVICTSNFASAILIEAGLSFLGLGVQPPTPSWGMMVNEGFAVIGTPNSWHLIIFPSLSISLMVLAFNLLGNGLRDAFDPKMLNAGNGK